MVIHDSRHAIYSAILRELLSTVGSTNHAITLLARHGQTIIGDFQLGSYKTESVGPRIK